VRQFGAAFGQASLLAASFSSNLSQLWHGQQAGLTESGSKLPHSKSSPSMTLEV